MKDVYYGELADVEGETVKSKILGFIKDSTDHTYDCCYNLKDELLSLLNKKEELVDMIVEEKSLGIELTLDDFHRIIKPAIISKIGIKNLSQLVYWDKDHTNCNIFIEQGKIYASVNGSTKAEKFTGYAIEFTNIRNFVIYKVENL